VKNSWNQARPDLGISKRITAASQEYTGLLGQLSAATQVIHLHMVFWLSSDKISKISSGIRQKERNSYAASEER
jgi:hypothetical protein